MAPCIERDSRRSHLGPDAASGHQQKQGILATVAAFFMFAVTLGIACSFVILYGYIQREFYSSDVATGWISSIDWACMNLLAPLSSALYVKCGGQTVAFIGVLLSFIGLLATSFVHHLWLMYLTYGVLFGAGSNLILTAAINVVTSHYPGRNNVRAMSLTSCGQPVGFLVISTSLERACYYIGWRNGVRIMSACMLVLGIGCSVLLKQRQRGEVAGSKKPAKSSSDLAESQIAKGMVNSSQTTRNKPTTCAGNNELMLNDNTIRSIGTKSYGDREYQSLPSDENPAHEATTMEGSSTEISCKHEHTHSVNPADRATDEGSPTGTSYGHNSDENLACGGATDEPGSPTSRRHVSYMHLSNDSEVDDKTLATANTSPCELPHNMSDQLKCEDFILESSTMNPDDGLPHHRAIEASFWIRYLRLIRLPGHWFFFVAIIGSTLASLFIVVHFVSFAVSIGVSDILASRLLIWMALVEIGARLPLILVGDRIKFNKTIMFAVVCLLGALCTYGAVLWPSLASLISYVIILGFVRGIIYSIAFPAIVDLFGIDNVVGSYTSLLVSYGIAGAMTSTVGGTSKDVTGSFTISLHILAALFLLSAVNFICAHIWQTRCVPSASVGRRSHEGDVNRNDSDTAAATAV